MLCLGSSPVICMLTSCLAGWSFILIWTASIVSTKPWLSTPGTYAVQDGLDSRPSKYCLHNCSIMTCTVPAGQVEQKRLSIPADVPCAVQQWQGLIAVNYAARAAGEGSAHRAHTLCCCVLGIGGRWSNRAIMQRTSALQSSGTAMVLAWQQHACSCPACCVLDMA